MLRNTADLKQSTECIVCVYVTVRHMLGEHITEDNSKYDMFNGTWRIKCSLEKVIGKTQIDYEETVRS